MLNDTVYALSTPPVNSPVALIRVSGPDAVRVLETLFSRPGKLEPRKAVFGSIISGNSTVDDVIALTYKAPESFTGEDTAEIFCHGNTFVVRSILGLLEEAGLRPAGPGEFSRRAFLNGKMDLTGAEALNGLISARSEWAVRTAISQMHGSLGKRIQGLRESVIELKADVEAGIDFIEEEIEFVSREDAVSRLGDIRDEINAVRGRCLAGERQRGGINVTIAGRPNAGKSSIMNLLLNRERSIVSEIPGTTRDIVSGSIALGGVEISVFDTAGIREPENSIEETGVRLAVESAEKADLLLLVMDSAAGPGAPDSGIPGFIMEKKHILIINKTDICPPALLEELGLKYPGALMFSARTGSGLDELINRISIFVRDEYEGDGLLYIADARVISLLEKAALCAEAAAGIFRESGPVEIAAAELQSLIDAFLEITGEISPEDILDSIFSRFCIGK